MLGALAQFERDVLRERTVAGLAAANQRGERVGRQALTPAQVCEGCSIAARRQNEALRVLATVNVRMLIIDETHHVLAGPLLKQRRFLNVIKYLGNELQIPIVAAGTRDAFNAIQTDPQLAKRFEPALLPRWTMDDNLRLLASFEVALPLEHPSGLIEPALATKILSLSGGTIGEISTLLSRAALTAVERGIERITGAVLDSCGYISPSERRRLALST